MSIRKTHEQYIKELREKNPGFECLEEYSGTHTKIKHKHLECGLIWDTRPKTMVGGHGCPDCNTAMKKLRILNEKQRNRAIQKLNEIDYLEVLGRYINQSIPIKVRNRNCGHEFESRPTNLINRGTTCPVCNKETKIQRCKANSAKQKAEYQLTASDWEAYRSEVHQLTRRIYSIHEKTINPNNLPRGLAGTKDAYQLDHIRGVRECFDAGIPFNECAHQDNLQMLPWRDNIQKR